MLKQGEQDPVNTEGWLHNARHVCPCRLLFLFCLAYHMLWQEGALLLGAIWQVNRPRGLAIFLHILDKACQLVCWELFQPLLHRSPLLLERLHDSNARSFCWHHHIDNNGLVKGLTVEQVTFCSRGMGIEVEASAVRNACTLQPANRCLNLWVPAVIGIVCHLRGKVLAKTDVVCFDANADEEEVRPCNEVAQGLVVNHFLGHRLANGNFDGRLARQLSAGREQHQLFCCNIFELGMLLSVWFDEILNLGLCNLSQPRKSARCNFVAIDLADLCNAKRKAIGVLFQTKLVIQEDALRRLRSQIALNHA
mmetsp:Transcript_131077/g.261537  ORF Transcript_131077/g.261537 Transcript_131077/m.261537 type:complete len:308 (-) Transcript_131077:587-1510(-)